jgi:hypothetical protein
MWPVLLWEHVEELLEQLLMDQAFGPIPLHFGELLQQIQQTLPPCPDGDLGEGFASLRV